MLTLAFGLASIFTLVAAQQDCPVVIDNCYGGALPDDGLAPSPDLSETQQRQLWLDVCSTVLSAGSCLDNIRGTCELDAIVAKYTYARLCTLGYQDFIAALNCAEAATTSAQYTQCLASAVSAVGADFCRNVENILACTNTSFEQHCGSTTSVAGEIFTDAVIVSSRKSLYEQGTDYSNCPVLANADIPFDSPPATEGPVGPCNGQIDVCYGNINVDSLINFSLPSPERQAIFDSLCSTTVGAGSCLEQVTGDAACLTQAQLSLAQHNYMCANTYEDVINGYLCMGMAALPVANQDYCPGLTDNYDGTTDVQVFYCNFYVQYLACISRHIDESCTDGAEFAKGFHARFFAFSVASQVTPDCPLIQEHGPEDPVTVPNVPNQPGNVPTLPGNVPNLPGNLPNLPGNVSNLPGNIPNQPGNVPNHPSPNICEIQINGCYGNLGLTTFLNENLPASTREILFHNFCSSETQTDAARCLSRINANLDCSHTVGDTMDLYGYGCTRSFTEISNAITCIAQATAATAESACVTEDSYDGTSDIAEWQCIYATTRKNCIKANMAWVCDSVTRPVALDLLDLVTAQAERAHVNNDCPVLQEAAGSTAPNQPDQPGVGVCEIEIETCYDGIQGFNLFMDDSLPAGTREILFDNFCSAHDNAAGCLSRIHSNLDCTQTIADGTAIYDYGCTRSFTDVSNSIKCIEKSRMNVDQSGCGRVTDVVSDMAEFQCISSIANKNCMVADMARTCDSATFPVALDFLHLMTAQAVRAHVHSDCQLLQDASDVNSAPINSGVMMCVMPVLILILHVLTP